MFVPALVIAAPVHAQSVARWQPFIVEAALRFDLPARWLERVMRAESDGKVTIRGRPIRSPKGAIGLMQLMPGTWRAARHSLGLGNAPDDPHDNIIAGAFYLRQLYDQFGYPGLFAAYNAGPARYAAYLHAGRELPRETLAYLAEVVGPQPPVSVGEPPPAAAILFALGGEPGPSSIPAGASASLFAIKHDAP